MRSALEWERDRLDPPVALDVGAAGPVEHHLGDGGVGQQRLEWPEPHDFVGELRQQPLEAGGREQWLFASQQVDQTVAQRVGREGGVVAAFADDAAMHALHELDVARRHPVVACERCDGHAAAPRCAGPTPTRTARSSAARGEAVGEARRQHPGVDRAEDLVAERHSSEDRYAEHVGDLTSGQRSPGLLDDHRSHRAGERRRPHRPAQREVAAADDGDRCVRDFGHGPRGRVRRRVRSRRPPGSVRRAAPPPSAAPATASGLRGRVPMPARRAGAMPPPAPLRPRAGRAPPWASPAPRRASRAGPSSGSAPSPKIAGWSPSRSASRHPDEPSRASTSASDAARTDVPEPPFGDHNAINIANLLLGARADARRRQEEVRGKSSHGMAPRADRQDPIRVPALLYDRGSAERTR